MLAMARKEKETARIAMGIIKMVSGYEKYKGEKICRGMKRPKDGKYAGEWNVVKRSTMRGRRE